MHSANLAQGEPLAPTTSQWRPSVCSIIPLKNNSFPTSHCFSLRSAPGQWKLAKIIMVYKRPTKKTVAPHPAIAQSLSLTPSTRFLLLCSKSTFLEPLAPIFNHNNTTLSRPPAYEIFESRSTSLYVLLLDWYAALNSALLRYVEPLHIVHPPSWPYTPMVSSLSQNQPINLLLSPYAGCPTMLPT